MWYLVWLSEFGVAGTISLYVVSAFEDVNMVKVIAQLYYAWVPFRVIWTKCDYASQLWLSPKLFMLWVLF